jgi:enamine deaminase RidA (YjgF/YER057c/UK114 family)
MRMPIPQGTYVPVTRLGNIAFTAGMTPRRDGELSLSGTVPVEASPETYEDAIRLCCSNALAALESVCNTGERITKILKMTVFIAAESGFTQHSRFADVASAYVMEQLGHEAIGARTAVGVASLPNDAPLEIDLIAAIEPNLL